MIIIFERNMIDNRYLYEYSLQVKLLLNLFYTDVYFLIT